MNTQNILKFFGTKLNIKLDSSEFYDHELSKVDDDYNEDLLDLSTPITYTGLTINTNLTNFNCSRNTITLVEYDNRPNDSSYPYSGLSATLTYSSFVNRISPTYQHVILNDDVYRYTGITGEVHFFIISNFNQSLNIHSGFTISNETQLIENFVSGTTSISKCEGRLGLPTYCCPITPKLNNKPWVYQFIDPIVDSCDPIIERRTEKGWTLDFIFNRESLPWSNGGTFYYFGVRGSSNPEEYSDNNLSFQFTPDRRVKWVAHHYSGVCDTTSGYTSNFYIASGQTPQLCTTGDTKDFNITIVFDRYKRFIDCDLENNGGWNDLLGWQINDYEDTEVTAVTSTQVATYNETSETLNKKWAGERQRRLGILKIYINGRPIYKLENWEEVVPSKRGVQPFIQSWGGGTGLMNNIHSGVCCFNMKSIKYYEEPLNSLQVRHNFLTRLNQYDFFICGEKCVDDIIGYFDDGLLMEDLGYILSEDNNVLLY